MMLALLLIVQAVETKTDISDVVVIGQRLERDFKANIRFGKGGTRCKIAKSTGDAEIDRIGCTALETCVPQFASRLQATNDRAIRPEVKRVMQGALNQEMANCFGRERSAGIAALSARRRTARSGG